jgi:transposase
MLTPSDGMTVYLACGSTDLRKSIDGLAAIVKYSFDLNVFSNSLFVFCNHGRNRLKILYWDHNGFWLYYRRLDSGTFKWPKHGSGPATLAVSRRQLQWLLDGLALEQHKAHAEVTARIVV